MLRPVSKNSSKNVQKWQFYRKVTRKLSVISMPPVTFFPVLARLARKSYPVIRVTGLLLKVNKSIYL